MRRLRILALASLSACGLFPSLDDLGGGDASPAGDASVKDVTELPDAIGVDSQPPEAGGDVTTTVHYQRAITIANNAGVALPTGYTIGVAFSDSVLQAAVGAGKMRSDYGDLRVRGSSGERDRLIDAPPLARVVWFSLSSPVAANKTDTSYVVTYGDPTASSPPENGAAVFEFYDDFGGSSVDGTKWMTQGSMTESGGNLTLPHGGLGALTTLSLPPLSTAEWRAKITDPQSNPDGSSGFYYWFGFQHTGDFVASDPWVIWIARAAGSIGPEDMADGCPSNCTNAPVAQSTSFRLYGIERQASQSIFSIDGATSFATPATNDQALSLMIRNWLVTGDVVVDWMRARTRIYPEPTVTLGPEQAL